MKIRKIVPKKAIRHDGMYVGKIVNNRNTAIEIFAVLLGSFLLTKAITILGGVRLFSSSSWPDPFIYTGYAENFSGLLNRYGGTYYGARISTIFPTWLRLHYDLPTQEFRVFLVALLTLGLYMGLRTIANRKTSFMLSVAACNTALLFRYYADDYTPGFVNLYTVYTLISLVRFSAAGSYPRIWMVLAGVNAGLVLNSNISMILILAPWVFIYLYSQNSLNLENKFREARLFTLGLLISSATCISIGIYWGGFRSFENYRATLGAISNIKLYESLFSRPLSQVSSFIILFAILMSLLILISLKTSHQKINNLEFKEYQRSKITYSSSIATIGTFVVGILYYIFISKSWFTISFYSFMYYPVMILPILLWIAGRHKTVVISISVLVVTVLTLYLAQQFVSLKMIQVSNFRIIFMLITLVILISYGIFRWNLLKVGLSGIILLSTTILPITQDWNPYWKSSSQNIFAGEYYDFLQPENQLINEATQEFAERFADFVKTNVPENEYFWNLYPNEPSWLRSIDSTQLWGYSCFNCTDLNGYPITREFPPVSLSALEILQSRRWVILFSSSRIATREAERKFLNEIKTAKVESRATYTFRSLELSLALMKVNNEGN